jgi:uncharacterized protein
LTDAYFDTSALVKLLIEEAGTDEAWEAWLDAAPITARISFAEVRAALAAAFRGGRLGPTSHERAKDLLGVLWDQMTPIEVDQTLVEHAANLGETHALRGYDAVHLAAALAAGAEVFISSNADQLQTARAESVLTLDPAAAP